MVSFHILVLFVFGYLIWKEWNQFYHFKLDMRFLTHEEILTFCLYLSPDLERNYPHFYRIVYPFSTVHFHQLLNHSVETVKVSSSKSLELRKEMNRILKEGSKKEKDLVCWYLTTCKWLQLTDFHKRRSGLKLLSYDISGDSRLKKIDIDAGLTRLVSIHH